jgi:hypothetical protein
MPPPPSPSLAPLDSVGGADVSLMNFDVLDLQPRLGPKLGAT